ncbi:MAG: hypothetical protein JWO78_1525 [Micavibrio sp.]|nr:hypothetical protein [Micavibrio sp.]
MLPKIMVYRDDYTATGLLMGSLKASFPSNQFEIIRVDLADLHNGAFGQGRNIFVLPGIVGEHCKYHRDFRSIMQDYRNFIEQGGVSLNICAGASTVASRCSYDTSWGTTKNKTALHPLFNGIAIGPITGYATKPEHAAIETALPTIVNTSIIPVSFKTETGDWQDTHLSYGNGPALLPDNRDDPAMEILATYHKRDHNAAALLRIQIGKGAAYLCGAHPEAYPSEIADRPEYAAIRAINEALKPHEENRQKLWTMLTNRMKKDLHHDI